MEQSTTSLFSSAALISKKTLRTLRDDFFISQNMSERVTKMVRRLREGVFKTSAFCFVGLPNFMQQAVKVNQQKQSRRSAHATVSGLFDLGLNYDTIGIHWTCNVGWYLCMTFLLWAASVDLSLHMQSLIGQQSLLRSWAPSLSATSQASVDRKWFGPTDRSN